MKKLFILFSFVVLTSTVFGQKPDNEFYFRVGYSSPSWKQYGMAKSDWNTFTEKTGGTFEVGSIFMINALPPAENMALGINVDYLYFTYSNFSDIVSQYDNLATIRAGSKIGPSFTFCPVKRMALDVYVKADINWASFSTLYYDKIDDGDDYYLGYGAVGLSTGFNFRYSVLMFGIEYNTINTKQESDDYPGEYLGNNKDNSNKTPLSCLNFTVGLCF